MELSPQSKPCFDLDPRDITDRLDILSWSDRTDLDITGLVSIARIKRVIFFSEAAKIRAAKPKAKPKAKTTRKRKTKNPLAKVLKATENMTLEEQKQLLKELTNA